MIRTSLPFAAGALAFAMIMSFTETSASNAEAPDAAPWAWHNAADLARHGQGWSDIAAPFDRMPARAQDQVRPEVWALPRDSAGIYVQFVTDAPALAARWRLNRDRLALWHMAASGASGLDLYVRDGDAWRWAAVGRAVSFPENERVLLKNLDAKEREFHLYLPLYNGVRSLEIGARRQSEEQSKQHWMR